MESLSAGKHGLRWTEREIENLKKEVLSYLPDQKIDWDHISMKLRRTKIACQSKWRQCKFTSSYNDKDMCQQNKMIVSSVKSLFNTDSVIQGVITGKHTKGVQYEYGQNSKGIFFIGAKQQNPEETLIQIPSSVVGWNFWAFVLCILLYGDIKLGDRVWRLLDVIEHDQKISVRTRINGVRTDKDVDQKFIKGITQIRDTQYINIININAIFDQLVQRAIGEENSESKMLPILQYNHAIRAVPLISQLMKQVQFFKRLGLRPEIIQEMIETFLLRLNN